MKQAMKNNQKYMKYALVLTVAVALSSFLLLKVGNKTQIDQNGQAYYEIVKGNTKMEVPVFSDNTLNQYVKSYQEKQLKKGKKEETTYQVNTLGNLTQILWTRKEGQRIERDTMVYHNQEQKPLKLGQLFHKWTSEEEEKLKTLTRLEWNKKKREASFPDWNEDVKLLENHWLLKDHQLCFEINLEGSNYEIGIPFYLLSEDIDWKQLGIKKEKDVWFQDYIKDRKVVAFTFDDGPNPNTTPILVQALKKRGMNATFFMLGTNVEKHPETVKYVDENGFEVASHTYQHRNLRKIPVGDQNYEIYHTQELIHQTIGKDPTAIRPPYGNYSEETLSFIQTPIVLWNVDTLDWKYRDANEIYQNSIDKIQDGDIVLMHDIYYRSVDAAILFADELYQRGYAVVSVQELAKAKNVTLIPKERYYRFS